MTLRKWVACAKPSSVGSKKWYAARITPGHDQLRPFECPAVGVQHAEQFAAFAQLRGGNESQLHAGEVFAVGFHALFDYAALYIFGAPNSGNRGGTPIDTRLLSGTFHGPSWLTGGPLGVEASWLVFPVIALLFLFFDRIHRAVRPVESPVGYDPPVSVQ